MPWQRLRTHVDPFVEREPPGNRPVIRARLQRINGYEPEFVAVGRAGFGGYVIFGFLRRTSTSWRACTPTTPPTSSSRTGSGFRS
jgi:hypothetical protein